MFFEPHKRKRHDSYNTPYGFAPGGLTTGQTFDIADGLVDLSRMGTGTGALTWSSAGFGMADVALSTATAKRGKKGAAGVAAFAAQSAGFAIFSPTKVVGAAIGQALIPIPVVGAAIGAIVGTVGSQLIADRLVRRSVFRGISATINGRMKVRFGGFQDSQPAFSMRQVAERELKSSRLAARRYLGREAALMHS